MAIKLIASDVDGTILHYKQKYHTYTRDALLRAADAGILTTLATGRSFSTAWPLYSELGMTAPLITLNGAVVRDRVMVYRNHLVDFSTLQPAIDFAREEDLFCMFFHGDELYAAHTEQECRSLIEAIGFSEEEGRLIRPFCGLEELYERCECQVNKIIFLWEQPDKNGASPMARVQKKLKRYLNDAIFPPFVEMTTSYHNNVELMPRGVNKGTGLAELCEAFQILPNEVMCFGDNENDIGMFDFAGHSVAMGNASKEVQQHARYVTGTVDEGGVGQMIDRVLAGEIS